VGERALGSPEAEKPAEAPAEETERMVTESPGPEDLEEKHGKNEDEEEPVGAAGTPAEEEAWIRSVEPPEQGAPEEPIEEEKETAPVPTEEEKEAAPVPADEEEEAAPVPTEEEEEAAPVPTEEAAGAEATSAFQPPQQDPRTLARALVSDILFYNRKKRDQALEEDKILAYLGKEIARSWEIYKERVGIATAVETDHFKEAVNEILAEGKKIL
jgi:hypothetical protein